MTPRCAKEAPDHLARSKLQRARDRRLIEEVRSRVLRWDPVGLVGLGAPIDEYDCLVGPLTSRLIAKTPAPDLADQLELEIEQHFGMGRPGTARQFVDQLAQWYLNFSASSDIQ